MLPIHPILAFLSFSVNNGYCAVNFFDKIDLVCYKFKSIRIVTLTNQSRMRCGMSTKFGRNFPSHKNQQSPGSKIGIEFRNNIYFLKKGNRVLPHATFFGKHPETDEFFMVFGSSKNYFVFKGGLGDGLHLCEKLRVFCEKDSYHVIEFRHDGKRGIIADPINPSFSHLYANDENTSPVTLISLHYEFVK